MSSYNQHIYYLGLGSNTDRRANLSSCIKYLACSFKFCVQSPVYKSPAYGFSGHDFYNLVVKIQTVLPPHLLKIWLNKIEDFHGRDRTKPRYSNRTLDIDLLLCGDLIINDGVIQIPRNEILKRSYVLKPLQDLAPDLIHPVAQKRLATLWQALEENESIDLSLVTSL